MDVSYVKCANCHGNHPASYGGCIARKTFVEIQNKISKKPRQQRSSRGFQYNESDFPETIQQRPSNQQNYRSAVLENSNQQQDNNMHQLLTTMMTTFNKLIDKLSTMIVELTRSLERTQATKLP